MNKSWKTFYHNLHFVCVFISETSTGNFEKENNTTKDFLTIGSLNMKLQKTLIDQTLEKLITDGLLKNFKTFFARK